MLGHKVEKPETIATAIRIGNPASWKTAAAARDEAAAIVKRAQAEAARLEQNSRQALRQAVRDAELMLKERLRALFDRVLRRQVGAALTPEALAAMVQHLVTQWSPGSQVEVTVGEADRQRLEALLVVGLGQELKDSVTLRASPAVSHGFRFELRAGSVYYEFTDAAIAETLRAFLNPSLRAMLNGDGPPATADDPRPDPTR